MRRKASICLLIALFVVAFVMPVAAQESATRGNIGGTVVDSIGAVVPGAKVTLSGPTGTQTQQSNQEGNFLFRTLIPGTYSVKVEKENFKSAAASDVQVVINRTTALRMTLQAGATSETVEVTASSVAVDTTSTAIGTNLTDSFYSSVPIPRGVAGLFYPAVGVVSGGGTGNSNPSISGGSGLENQYIADGVNITDPAFGGLGVFTRLQGSVGTGINLSFIKEVQVKTGGFEPQYGQSTGGIVQIVTKSGSNAFHGAIAGYAAPRELEMTRKQRDDVRFRNIGRNKGLTNYDASFELGGYVPGFKNNLFFFGAFNPSYTRNFVSAPERSTDTSLTQNGLFVLTGGKDISLKTNAYNYAGKLTLKLNDRNTVEGSVFGDPSHTGQGPNTTSLVIANTSGYSKWEYGTRNIVARYTGALTNTWLVNASFTHNNNDFTETPLQDVFQVQDLTQAGNSPILNGFGFLENHKSTSKTWTIDTSKVVNAFGEHTFSIGFNQQLPDYNNVKSRSGGFYAVPTLNATGGDPGYGCAAGDPACPLGGQANAQFQLLNADAACTLCPLYTNPNTGVTSNVYLTTVRGEFGPSVTPTTGNYMAAYANDSWNINKYVNVNLGLRWEQYHMEGALIKYTFTDNWSPRLGLVVDPWGDRKSKIYANFGRYAYQTPLDAAIRSLSGEDDLLSMDFAPVVNGPGSVTPVLDAAHLLNNATGGVAEDPSISAQVSAADATGFAPHTRLQYQDEYIVGFERELKSGFVFSTRYIDRRLRRMMEDVAGLSPEAFVSGIGQNYLIANPGRSTDLFQNEVSNLYPAGGAIPAACQGGLNPNTGAPITRRRDPIRDALGNVPSGFAGQAVCFSFLGNVTNAFGQLVPQYGGAFGADGKADGFPDPVRNYQAVEIELNKSFSKGFMLKTNYRIARNQGNYEGAFRNDNGQTDPNISSMFDFTEGRFNFLGDQFRVGALPTDRRHVVNGFFSYTFPGGRAKNLTLGTGIRVQSGTPISALGNHPAYRNAGEVPFGGRGVLGRTPTTGEVDLHTDYPWSITENTKLRFGADLFNITNSKPILTVDQSRDISGQAANTNADFRQPLTYQRPFYARFSVRFEF